MLSGSPQHGLSKSWVSQSAFDIVSRNLASLGGLSLDEYLYGGTDTGLSPTTHAPERDASPLSAALPEISPTPPLAKATETVSVSAVARLHQTCQRVFGNADALKFEYIEQNGPRNKQCILTITRPEGTKRSYATQPTFAKKNEAKAGAAMIAIEMGALEFLMNGDGEATKPKRGLLLSSVPAVRVDSAAAEPIPSTSKATNDAVSPIDEIERCCAEWRAGRVAPHWVAFFEPKLGHKQGCALRIQLSPHVVRVYLSDPTFDSYAEAKLACAKAAVSEGVLDFIRLGNGQTRPQSPTPFSTPASSEQAAAISSAKTPLTLQNFYDSLPRPFPESFDTTDAVEINAPGWLNAMVQNARGGKLAMMFFFTSDGTPGLHGCVLKFDRPGDYRAYIVDAWFPKRSDAKAAVCLQAMSHNVGNYIRKIGMELRPYFEFEKERDTFGATWVVELSTTPTPEQVRRYTVPTNYRNKADAKAAAICCAAEQGAVEFIRFGGENPPPGYVSPYTLRNYDPAAQKRRHPEGTDELESGRPSKKQKKGKKREVEVAPIQGESSQASLVGRSQPSRSGSHQIHDVPGPGGIGSLQAVSRQYSLDQSQPGFGNEGGSGAPYYAPYSHGPPFTPQAVHGGAVGASGSHHIYGVHQPPMTYAPNSPHPPSHTPHHTPPPRGSNGPTHVGSSASSRPVPHLLASTRPSHTDPEPGEVLSSKESEFSEGSSQNSQRAKTRESKSKVRGKSRPGNPQGTSTANTSTATSPEGQGAECKSYVDKLIKHCAQNGLGTPKFHEEKSEKFKVWIIIGKERFDLPATYRTAEEGHQRVAKQVLARLRRQTD
ncbi:hypothetical protein BU15DRAFT_72469 [Melanogaster broomeanus]|nr:hypothetical protein BU15DRAFT_72469 [Melanogaster broomeanus]